MGIYILGWLPIIQLMQVITVMSHKGLAPALTWPQTNSPPFFQHILMGSKLAPTIQLLMFFESHGIHRSPHQPTIQVAFLSLLTDHP